MLGLTVRSALLDQHRCAAEHGGAGTLDDPLGAISFAARAAVAEAVHQSVELCGQLGLIGLRPDAGPDHGFEQGVQQQAAVSEGRGRRGTEVEPREVAAASAAVVDECRAVADRQLCHAHLL